MSWKTKETIKYSNLQTQFWLNPLKTQLRIVSITKKKSKIMLQQMNETKLSTNTSSYVSKDVTTEMLRNTFHTNFYGLILRETILWSRLQWPHGCGLTLDVLYYPVSTGVQTQARSHVSASAKIEAPSPNPLIDDVQPAVEKSSWDV